MDKEYSHINLKDISQQLDEIIYESISRIEHIQAIQVSLETIGKLYCLDNNAVLQVNDYTLTRNGVYQVQQEVGDSSREFIFIMKIYDKDKFGNNIVRRVVPYGKDFIVTLKSKIFGTYIVDEMGYKNSKYKCESKEMYTLTSRGDITPYEIVNKSLHEILKTYSNIQSEKYNDLVNDMKKVQDMLIEMKILDKNSVVNIVLQDSVLQDKKKFQAEINTLV